jgi:hypothetical protein
VATLVDDGASGEAEAFTALDEVIGHAPIIDVSMVARRHGCREWCHPAAAPLHRDSCGAGVT